MFRTERVRGFTLIELLTVLAVLSILAVVLFPVFAQAREKARQASCLSNLRQIGIASLLYAQDADETLPPWQVNVLLYWVGGRTRAGLPLDKSRGLIWPYLKSGAIQNCPSYVGGRRLGGTGYGMNILLDRAPLATLDRPTETLLFADAGIPDFPERGKIGETIIIQPPYLWVPSPEMDFRHQGATHIAWADSHVNRMARLAFLRPLIAAEARSDRRFFGDYLMARRKN